MTPYDHPRYLAFIDAIRLRPDDDNVRLVAADWLEEQGEADRAAFVRVQVERERLERASGGKLPVRVGSAFEFLSPIGTYDTIAPDKYPIGSVIQVGTRDVEIFGPVRAIRNADPCPLRDRWRELARLEGEMWGWWQIDGETKKAMLNDNGIAKEALSEACTYSRGFLERLRIRGADWITHAEAILKRNPVRKVVIVGDVSEIGQARYSDIWRGIEFTFERESPTPPPLVSAAVAGDQLTLTWGSVCTNLSRLGMTYFW